MQNDKHKFLTEKVLHQNHEEQKYDFDTWNGFGVLFQAAQKESWWWDFMAFDKRAFVSGVYQGRTAHSFSDSRETYANINLINPKIFSDYLYRFLIESK